MQCTHVRGANKKITFHIIPLVKISGS